MTEHVEARQYRVLQLLGQGGFGKVYRARLEGAEGFRKDVAIKLLHDDDFPDTVLQRFRDEARILGLIRDRAIVNVDPPTRLGGQWAVVMEYVDGISCNHLLQTGPLPPTIALEIVEEVARALDVLFNQIGPDGEPLRLIHRDLKPANIQITPTGQVKILDFGIARAHFKGREAESTDRIAGTPAYIAPERFSDPRIEVPAGDIYSLGVVLYKLVTGALPGQPRPSPPMNLLADGSVDVEEASIELEGLDAILALSEEMRAPNPEDRPAAREVERRCRQLHDGLPDLYLRDWAETHVPEGPGLPADDLVGSVLFETPSGQPPSPLLPAQDPQSAPQLYLPKAPRGRAVILAIIGFLAVVLLLIVALAAGLGVGAILRSSPEPKPEEVVEEPAPPAEPMAEEPAPTELVESPTVHAEPEPEPVVEASPPEPVAPTPRPKPRVVTAPEPEPVPTGPTYPLTITSVPMGLEVRIDGELVGTTPIMGHELVQGEHELRVGKGERVIQVGRRTPNRFVYQSEGGTWEALY